MLKKTTKKLAIVFVGSVRTVVIAITPLTLRVTSNSQTREEAGSYIAADYNNKIIKQ